jgi:Leucine-rich repeat (LRR) protein
VLPANLLVGLNFLRYLYLFGNSLSAVAAGVFNGKLLEVLDLSQSALKTLPVGAFCGISTLRSLDLSFNTLNTLPVGMFSGLGAGRLAQLLS